MRNNLKPESFINKTYLELDLIKKIESLEDYPGTKPILLARNDGTLLYSNGSCQKLFGLKKNNNLFAFNI